MDAIRAEWARRVEAEYRSAAWAAELLTWLIRAALSPDTLALTQRMVADELAHAELGRAVLLAAGGEPEAVYIPRDSLVLPHAPGLPEELRALLVAADLLCCGETVAVPLFAALREGASEPAAVAALDRVLRDEPAHSALGWILLDELLERLGPLGRAWLAPQLPACLERLHRAYGHSGGTCTPTQRAWGLMAPVEYSRVLVQAVEERLRPRFAARGLEL